MTRKQQARWKKYGTTQQTVPVLMPDTRYEAFKRILQGSGRHVNKVLRDLIEEVYGEQLDTKEQEIVLEWGVHESTENDSNANARLAS